MPDEPEQLERLRAAFGDRYHIERELGRGGMATVYLAEEPRHSRHLALKVLRPELAASIGADRFLREIKTTASLTHPHILPLFDSGNADGFLFYVMPYVEGESLRDRLNRESQLPIEEAVRITSEIAGALGFAHSRDVLHRDIKPENILLEAGHAVVADFGIARAITVAAGEQLTVTGLAIGTPQYMSPEQAAGDRQLDGRSDQYSLACLLYEMIIGDPPFAGSSRQAVLARKMIEPAPALRALRETVPTAVEQAVARALERVAADRYPTMQSFDIALRDGDSALRRDVKRASADSSAVGKGVTTVLPIELKPLAEELDVFGLTHPGKVQRVNQDHFLICSLMRGMDIHYTSLPNDSLLPRRAERRAFVAAVADGVGRGEWGERASRIAMESMAQFMVHSIRDYDTSDENGEREFLRTLQAAVLQFQANVAQRAWESPGAQGMGTGLTMWIGMWPRSYFIQLGTSRSYQLAEGKLTQVTGGQTFERIGEPVIRGEGQKLPLVFQIEQRWGTVGLICTEGLTRHVSDEQIASRLATATTAKQACQELLDDALTAGGSENITIVVGRTRPNPDG
jgi:serine/threonine protein kinase